MFISYKIKRSKNVLFMKCECTLESLEKYFLITTDTKPIKKHGKMKKKLVPLIRMFEHVHSRKKKHVIF